MNRLTPEAAAVFAQVIPVLLLAFVVQPWVRVALRPSPNSTSGTRKQRRIKRELDSAITSVMRWVYLPFLLLLVVAEYACLKSVADGRESVPSWLPLCTSLGALSSIMVNTGLSWVRGPVLEESTLRGRTHSAPDPRGSGRPEQPR